MPLDTNTAATAGTTGGAQTSRVSAFHFEPFNSELTTWKRWVKRFETAMELFNSDSTKKTHLLLHYMGTTTYNILCDKVSPRTPEDITYREIVTILEEHYDPKPNEILENYRFHLRKQKPEENCSQFLIALRRLANGCNFGQYLDTALRNQFVFGLLNQRIQSRLLEEKSLTVEKAENMASAFEVAERGGVELHQKTSSGLVNKLHDKKYAKKGKQKQGKKEEALNTPNEKNGKESKCFRCGNTAHMASQCPYKNTICHFCKIKGHLRKVCLKEKRQLHQISTDMENSTQTVEELFQINGSTDNARAKIMHTLIVNGVSMEFEVDTGATVTIVGLSDAKKHFGKEKIFPSDTKLYSYCNTALDCAGYIQVDVSTSTRKLSMRMYVVRSNHKPLMGREWLRVIPIDWKKLLERRGTNVNRIASAEGSKLEAEVFLKKFPRLFSATPGKITDFQARLHLKPNAAPRALKARRIAFPLFSSVERELQKQVDDGLLVKVDNSEWATPIVVVRKSNGAVRLCGDYKVTVNPALMLDDHPLPTIDELFSTLAGGEKFTKIDLSKAYLQLEIHPNDRHILTLSTHKGLFQPTRLMFGIASAPAIWQRFMEQLLSGIPGTSVFLDDIKISAKDDETHRQRIEEVLKRLDEHNMRVNLEKSEFMSDCISYCGYVIDKHGIHKMDDKVKAIQNMKTPVNKDEVRSFVGLVNYYGRFIKGLSTILYPLNRLLQNNVKFEFDASCERAFQEVKAQIQSDVVLTHYDPKRPLLLAVDASPVGVGAVLSHQFEDGTERPIQFASQTLNKTQQGYSQIDKEAYAIIFGVKRFYQFVYGRRFTLITDNKPISQIFSPVKGLPTLSATRMQHHALFLSAFNYEICVKKSKDNGNADAMSRLPVSDTYQNIEEIDLVEDEAIANLPVTRAELREHTEKDKSVNYLLQCLKHGRECEPSHRFGIPQVEFTLHDGCLLRSIRIYIPNPLRKRVLEELHTAHLGMSAMKALGRTYCWWPGMDKDIDQLVSNCTACQSIRADPVKLNPVHVWMRPTKPFERVHVDYAGPFLGKYLFILVDAYTKWPEAHIMPNMTASCTIQKCQEIFASFGIPQILVSDHGSQFNSVEFQTFLRSNGIFHKQGAPYHPSTNGQAERYVQTLKNKLRASNCSGASMQKELSTILMAYRRAVHPATQQSPAVLMLGRQLQSRLDLLNRKEPRDQNERILPQKEFSVGERVAIRDYLSANKWCFGRVAQRQGDLHYQVQLDDNRTWKRHADQMRKVGENLVGVESSNVRSDGATSARKSTETHPSPPRQCETSQAESESKQNEITTTPESRNNASKTAVPGEVLPRRSTRATKPPERLQYEHTFKKIS